MINGFRSHIALLKEKEKELEEEDNNLEELKKKKEEKIKIEEELKKLIEMISKFKVRKYESSTLVNSRNTSFAL